MRRLFVASVVVLAGCAAHRPEPRELAVERAARCSGESPDLASRLASPENVEAVEPLYSVVYSTPNGQESRLIGAKLRLRTIDGVTAESLTHALTCHAAAEVLRGDDACPYWIPDGFVEIGVRYVDDGYVVTLEGRDFDDANEILARARTFVRERSSIRAPSPLARNVCDDRY